MNLEKTYVFTQKPLFDKIDFDFWCYLKKITVDTYDSYLTEGL